MKIFSVWSAKGGVGKSSLAVLLAEILACKGKRVGILDADLYGPSIGHMTGCLSHATVLKEKIRPILCEGKRVLSLVQFPVFQDLHSVRAPIANQILKSLSEEVDWGDTEVLLIDMPPGTGDVQLTLSQLFPFTGAFIVTTPQEITLAIVKKSLAFLRAARIPILGLVENMSYFIEPLSGERLEMFGPSSAKPFCHSEEIRFWGQIPLVSELAASLDQGKNLAGLAKRTCFAPLEEIAVEICKEIWDNSSSKKSTAWRVLDGRVVLSEGGFEKSLSGRSIQSRCPCADCRKRLPVLDSGVKVV